MLRFGNRQVVSVFEAFVSAVAIAALAVWIVLMLATLTPDPMGVALAVGITYLMTGGTVIICNAMNWRKPEETGAAQRYLFEPKSRTIEELGPDDKPIKRGYNATAAPAILRRIQRGLVTPPIPHIVTIDQAQWYADQVLYAGMEQPTFRDDMPMSQEQWRQFKNWMLRVDLLEYRGRGYRKGYRVTDTGIQWARDIHTQYGPAPRRVKRMEKV